MCLYFLKSTFNKGVQGYGYKINVQNQEHSYTTNCITNPFGDALTLVKEAESCACALVLT